MVRGAELFRAGRRPCGRVLDLGLRAHAADSAGRLLQPAPAPPSRSRGRHRGHEQPDACGGLAPGRARAVSAENQVTMDGFGPPEPFDETAATAQCLPPWTSARLTCRDPAFARYAAVLPDGALPLPLSAWPGRAKSVHAPGG